MEWASAYGTADNGQRTAGATAVAKSSSFCCPLSAVLAHQLHSLPFVVRILVVDDEPAIRALVARIAQRAGFDVDVARDGAEAIAKLDDAARFDVVILDLMMPIVDGYGVIDHVRATGA